MACRIEAARRYPLANGRVITVIVRKNITPEDPYMTIAMAKALSIRTGEAISVNQVQRSVKDYLIKTNISI